MIVYMTDQFLLVGFFVIGYKRFIIHLKNRGVCFPKRIPFSVYIRRKIFENMEVLMATVTSHGEINAK